MSESTQSDTTPTAWPRGIAAITLFVEDMAVAKRFYRDFPTRVSGSNSRSVWATWMRWPRI